MPLKLNNVAETLSVHSDQNDYIELLDTIHSGNCIAITGSELTSWPFTNHNKRSGSHLGNLVERIVEWCVLEGIIDQTAAIEDFHRLVLGESWIRVGYKIEEYLTEKWQQQQCLRKILHDQAYNRETPGLLAQLPFRGYITTTYDTSIETAYSEIKQSKLAKFYGFSLRDIVEACQNQQPFILKLHGDIDEPNSIALGHRLSRGLSIADCQDQLRRLFATFSILFIGFEKGDPDLKVLLDLIKDEDVLHRPNSYWMVVHEDQLSVFEIKSYWEKKRIRTIFCKASDGQSGFVTLLETLDPQPPVSEGNLPASQADETSQQTTQSQKSPTSEFELPITIFMAYTREDNEMQRRIELELNTLQQQGLSIDWDKSEITEAIEWEIDIEDPLNTYNLVLLLVSPNFVGSTYCYSDRMKRAIVRHQEGAWICPILLRPCRWEGAPFGPEGIRNSGITLKHPLPVLPSDSVPVTKWPDLDDAYLNISKGIERAVKWLKSHR